MGTRMTMASIKCATVQFHHRANDKAYNMSVVERFSREAADQKVKILAFPEMCLTGYWPVRNLGREKLEELAEPVPCGPATRAVAQLSAQHDMAVGVGLIERGKDGRLFNTYVVCLPDGQFHRHRKLHAFESDDIASGDSYTVFDTPWGVKAGVLICWDNNLVDAPYLNRDPALVETAIKKLETRTKSPDRLPTGTRCSQPKLKKRSIFNGWGTRIRT
jgi:predicted amidohydrolase